MPAAMSERGALPPWFGKRNSHGVPIRALLLGAVISAALTLAASTRAGVAAFNFAALLATATNLVLYLFCAIAAVRFMGDGRLPRSVGLVVAAGGAVIFAVYALYGSGWESLIWGSVLVAAGWPLHRLAQAVARSAATAPVAPTAATSAG